MFKANIFNQLQCTQCCVMHFPCTVSLNFHQDLESMLYDYLNFVAIISKW